MTSLKLFADSPDDWKEYVHAGGGKVTQRIEATAKIAPFQTKILPEQPGAEFVQVHFVAGDDGRPPELGVFNDGAHAWVYVDVAALGWIKGQWAQGRRIEVTLWSTNYVAGFTLGTAPDGSDVVWDQSVAKSVKMDSATLEVFAYRAGAGGQSGEALMPPAPHYSDVQSKLSKITSRLDLLVGLVVAFLAWYWARK
ncbi:hypothetical protein [Burkholderia ubonensis]|uniref:hypothetical protein n=1 Tax=Burkholderia ubonensis TaxID=101571 RepID=UPI0012F85101|nr:hypothetical protein [Burkholderia ubonensis]